MKNKSNTQKSLFLSAVSLMLCVVMLVGMTFAWFTDSVTNKNNKIASGNLDAKLMYSKDGETWTEVESDTKIFGENALWEPGYTEVIYLKVKNAGNLALKYKIGMNIAQETAGINVNGEQFKLSEYIKFGVKETETVYENRQAVDAVKADSSPLSAGYAGEDKELKKGEESKMMALVVYMPDDVGNVANHNGINVPSIDLGVSMVATQLSSESDSFGNNYDANAQYPAVEYGDIIAPTPAAEFEEKLNSAQNGDTIVVNGTVALTKSLTVSKDITIKAGTAGATFTGTPLHIGKDVNVVLEGLNFNRPTNVNDTASAVYASDFSGDLTVKNCIFTDCAWEGIQITPAENCGKIEIIGCEFKNPNLKSIRFLHIEADPNVGTNANIVIADNDFGALEQLNLNDRRASMIDVDYIDSFDRLTAYGNNIKQGTDDIYVYVCLDNAGQYKMLNNSVTFFTKAK